MQFPGLSNDEMLWLRDHVKASGRTTWHLTLMMHVTRGIRSHVGQVLVMALAMPFMIVYTIVWRLPRFFWDYARLGHDACGKKYHFD